MTVLVENSHAGCMLVSEQSAFYSRDTIAIANAATSILPGTVLAKSGVPAAETVVAAADANTGNGTLTLDPTAPIAATAVDGPYKVEFTAATTFNLLDPTGKIAGKGTVGQVFSGPLKFTIAAGATAFVAGDSFTLTNLRPDGTGDQWAPLDAGFVGPIAGVLFGFVPPYPVGGASALVPAVAVVRAAEVRASDLIWPVGATAAQIAEGTLALKRLGVISR